MLLPGLVVALFASPTPWAAPASEPAPIFGGDQVDPGAYPTAVAIELGLKLCTGTLVSDRVVLTAAHCLEAKPDVAFMRVKIGDDVYTDYSQSLAVADYGTHPDYCGSDPKVCKTDIWDYGYVLLEEPVVGVQPTRPLTGQAQWDEAMKIGAPITVVGYGNDEGDLNGVKREVEVPIVRFSGTGLEFQAGGMGLDSCQGDSGGPAFVTLTTGEVVLAGITSRGYACGEGGFYAIPYASLCWLNQETGVDLRTDACDACDCLAIDPDADASCGCAASDPAGPLGFASLLVWAGLRTRRRRTSRRSRQRGHRAVRR